MRQLVLTLCAAALTACVGAVRPSVSTLPPEQAPRNAVLAQELVAAHVGDAYQAVVRLRPEFLRHAMALAAASPAANREVRVRLDGFEVGGIDALHTILLDDVTEIRYFSPSEAALRWGADGASGVILVSTQRARY